MKIQVSKFIAQVASMSASSVIGLGISIVSGIFLTRLLGPSNKGIVATLLVIPGLIISFSDLGLRQATTFFMGKKVYDDDSVLSTISILFIFTALLSIGIASILYVIGGYLKLYGFTFLLISLAIIPVNLVITYGNGILLGKKKIYELSFSAIIPNIVYLILVVLIYFVPEEKHVLAAIIANVLSPLLASIYIIWVVLKIGKIRPRYIPGLPWLFIKKGFIYAIALFLLGLNYHVDILILGRLSSSYEVGIYSVGVGFSNLLWLLPGALTSVNFSHSANATDAMQYAKKTARILRLALWVGLVPALAVYVVSPWIIPFIYGSEFQTSGIVVQAILPGVWMALIFKILHSDLAGRGRPLAALWVFGAAAIINIILNIWWDPLFGAVGAAWASTVSYSVGAIIFLFTYANISQINITELIILKKTDFSGIFRR